MSPQDLSTVFAGISSGGAIVTAAIAAWTLTSSRLDSRERTRPLVTAALVPGPSYSHGTTYLVIKNVGATAARGLKVAFDPPLPGYETTEDGQKAVVGPFLRRRYASPIPVLAPGQELVNIYGYLTASRQRTNAEPVPDRFTVAVRYKSERRRREYTDSFSLDLTFLYDDTRLSPGDNNKSDVRTNKALEAIAWETWKKSQ